MISKRSEAAKEQREVSWSDCYDVPGPDLFEKVALSAGTADNARLLFPYFLRRTVCSANVNRVKMADHSQTDLDYVIETMETLGHKYDII